MTDEIRAWLQMRATIGARRMVNHPFPAPPGVEKVFFQDDTGIWWMAKLHRGGNPSFYVQV